MDTKLKQGVRVMLSVVGIAIIIIVCFILNSRFGIIGAAPLVAGISGVCPCKKGVEYLKSRQQGN